MGPWGIRKKDHSCSVNFRRTKESQLTQEGVHPNIELFEHLCNETLLDRDSGSAERNEGFKRKQEKAVSGVQGPHSNEAKHQIHVNVLEPKEGVKRDTDNEILYRQLERLWKKDFGDSAVGTDNLLSVEDNKALNKMEQSL